MGDLWTKCGYWVANAERAQNLLETVIITTYLAYLINYIFKSGCTNEIWSHRGQKLLIRNFPNRVRISSVFSAQSDGIPPFRCTLNTSSSTSHYLCNTKNENGSKIKVGPDPPFLCSLSHTITNSTKQRHHKPYQIIVNSNHN